MRTPALAKSLEALPSSYILLSFRTDQLLASFLSSASASFSCFSCFSRSFFSLGVSWLSPSPSSESAGALAASGSGVSVVACSAAPLFAPVCAPLASSPQAQSVGGQLPAAQLVLHHASSAPAEMDTHDDASGVTSVAGRGV